MSFTGDTFETNASFYGHKDGLNGRKTANGERLDKYALTAAHKTLKFGTLLEVTNIKNSKSVIVRINDRGPFVKGRGLDLTYGAFREIADPRQGVVRVRAKIVEHEYIQRKLN